MSRLPRSVRLCLISKPNWMSSFSSGLATRCTSRQLGAVFYTEALRILDQVERAAASAKSIARWQVGSLSIAFIPAATQHFLPELLQKFREQNPTVALNIQELTPAKQIEAFARGEIDLGFTQDMTGGEGQAFTSQQLFTVPLGAIFPSSRRLSGPTIEVAELEREHFVLLERVESPVLYDSIVGMCNRAGFSPRFIDKAHLIESILTLVQSQSGISILPAWVRVFARQGLQFVNLSPSTLCIELVAQWRSGSHSVPLQSFLKTLNTELPGIQAKTAQQYGLDRGIPQSQTLGCVRQVAPEIETDLVPQCRTPVRAGQSGVVCGQTACVPVTETHTGR